MKDKKNIIIKNVEMSKPLLEFLQPSPSSGWSKWDAYHDLLRRASDYRHEVTRFGQTFHLSPGEFIVTTTELAKAWKWSRITVRKYLSKLVDLGQMAVTSHIKCCQVDMLSMKFLWADGSAVELPQRDTASMKESFPSDDICDDSIFEEGCAEVLMGKSPQASQGKHKASSKPTAISFEDISKPSSDEAANAVSDAKASPDDKV